MDAVHLHLIVNHLPIIFPVVGAIVLITAIVSKSHAVMRTAFMIFIIGAISTIFAMNSGDGAEDIVEKISGVSKKFIESHEEAAETFSVLSYLLGGLSLLGLWASFKQKTFANIIAIATLVFAFVVLFFAKQTGTSGGEIRHTEIRSGYTTPASENNTVKDND